MGEYTTREKYIEFYENEKELKDFFGDTDIMVGDVLEAMTNLIIEHNELQRKLEEDYVQREIDPYDEYGLNENDFH